jgi:hypothetical protein
LRIDVTSTGFALTKARRGEVRRRVLLAMSRFGREVYSVRAHLAEADNPLGGVDQSCRVRARLRGGLVLRADAIGGQIDATVGRSATRLALLVTAVLDGAAAARPSPPPAARRRRPINRSSRGNS